MGLRGKAKEFKEKIGTSLKEKAEELTDRLVAKLSIQDLDEDSSTLLSDGDDSSALATPKRLFNVDTMKTMLYEDCKDIKEEGYVCISHVWGKQKRYTPRGVGVMGGVTWTIPLSDPDKILRMKAAMLHLREKYCWFDVLCLPQDNQSQIEEEIPLMGDYYGGADTVLVFPTTNLTTSEDFTKWDKMMDDIMEKERSFNQEERDWILSYLFDEDKPKLLDLSKEEWFERLWTFQEAAAAKDIIVCNNGNYIRLLDIAKKVDHMNFANPEFPEYLFGDSSKCLLDLADKNDAYINKYPTLAGMMVVSSNRKCFKEQDKFYGILGILGYRDFPVDYDMCMYNLNKAIVKHAYSKKDTSWLTVCGDTGDGFIQTMHEPFTCLGLDWEEETPDICEIKIEGDILHLNAWPIADVDCCEKFSDDVTDDVSLVAYLTQKFRDWKLDDTDIANVIMSFRDEPDIIVKMVMIAMDSTDYVYEDEVRDKMRFQLGDELEERIDDLILVMKELYDMDDMTLVRATLKETGKNIALIVQGNVDEGDQIMLVRMHDVYDRALGIVVNKHSIRRGLCYYKKLEMSDNDISSRYVPQEFAL